MLTIDGSEGEGGGQMLRTALAWSVITQTPFRMVNIRARRKDPGLKAQHVTAFRALQVLGPVGFSGAKVGSAVVEFHPAPLRGADARIDIGTAGSIGLVLQALLPAALRAEGPSRLTLIGGTDVAWSPPIDFLDNVALGPARERAENLRLEVVRRGFYPQGRGEVVVEAHGWRNPPPIEASRPGELCGVRILSTASEMLADRRVAERQAESAKAALHRLGVPIHTRAAYADTASPGSSITCVAEFEGGGRMGGSGLGERGKPAEEVGRAAGELLASEVETGAAVDSHGADQVIIWLALSGGSVRASEVTEHTRTAIKVTECFTGRLFQIDGTTIRCPVSFSTY